VHYLNGLAKRLDRVAYEGITAVRRLAMINTAKRSSGSYIMNVQIYKRMSQQRNYR